MMIVGLTGGIGSGKTTVAKMFKELGVPVYNSDEEAKRLMNTSKKVINAITKLFGPQAYINTKLNSADIAKKVFENKELLLKLNAIVHPEVRKHFLTWMKKQHYPYVIQETALIFENSSPNFYDKIILITAPMNKRIQRVKNRDGISKKSILSRMENQWNDSAKIPLSDFVVENINLAVTKSKIRKIHQCLLKYS
ncbi:MAG: dephospho-CoA kinase [Maribacter sp.]|nr:dephospho-CoA kinase [Maribacter sp.]